MVKEGYIIYMHCIYDTVHMVSGGSDGDALGNVGDLSSVLGQKMP